MIKAIVIDDEQAVREDLIDRLQEYFSEDIVVVAEADNVQDGIKVIEKYKPDLLLLDIHLPPGTGFELLEQSSYKDFGLIFVTAYDQHAIKAIKVGALDYILKPVDSEEFNAAIRKAQESSNQATKLEKLIEISSEYFRKAEKKRVILRTAETVYVVNEDDILYCRSEGNYTTFYTRQIDKVVISKSIKQTQEILSEDIFIRCHQSFLVNKQHVLKYNKQGVLILPLDIKVPVSSRRKDYALEKIFN